MTFRQQVLALQIGLNQLGVALLAEGRFGQQAAIGADLGQLAGFDHGAAVAGCQGQLPLADVTDSGAPQGNLNRLGALPLAVQPWQW